MRVNYRANWTPSTKEPLMPHIDLPADLNFVDDDGSNLARTPSTGAPAAGAVLIAGTPAARSWAAVEDVEHGWVRFRLVAAPEGVSTPKVARLPE
jgi:hypothetical protein